VSQTGFITDQMKKAGEALNLTCFLVQRDQQKVCIERGNVGNELP
jgi:hypothetical protein